MRTRMRMIPAALVLLAALILSGCEQYPKTIIEPEQGLRNTSTLEFPKIELTDTATIFHVDAFFLPKNWIRIASDTYLQANGEKYLITGSEGILIDSLHWMPESGEDHFTLFFPPLPEGTKRVDFIEGDCDDCFKIWDIDLTGKGLNYTPDIPKELLNAPIDKTTELLPADLATGRTTLRIHLTGLQDGYALTTGELRFNDSFLLEQRRIAPKNTEGNVYTYEFDQNGPILGRVNFNKANVSVFLSPGETADVYLDMAAYSKRECRIKPNKDLRYIGFTGKYAALNTEMALLDPKKYEDLVEEEENDGAPDIDAQEWINKKEERMNKKLSRYENDSEISPALKTYLSDAAKLDFMYDLRSITWVYDSAYRKKHNLGQQDKTDYIPPLFDDTMAFRLKDMDLNNPRHLSQYMYLYTYPSIAYSISSEEKLNELTGTTTGLLQDLRKVDPLMRTAGSLGEIPQETMDILNTLSIPVFKEAFLNARAEAKRQYEEAMSKGGFVILDTPQAPNDKLLEAIIAQHKGKAIFIDFWATWCGPCLNAMKQIKPFKPEMAEKGVEVIYISNVSSPKAKWMTMLPDIGASHYYLTSEQWRAVSDKYKIEGIPCYMIVDKSGKITYQQSGFPGVDHLRKEFSKVW